MTGAQALIRSLNREGVDLIFGLPGVQILEIFDALYDEPAVRLVTTRHEQGVAYMADGYARSTGRVGVGLVVPGPGALNATAGLGTAYSCSSPVLLLAGQAHTDEINRGAGVLHEVDDQLDVFRPITKWCSRLTGVEEVPSGVHRAMEYLQTGRPRPVELEIPWNVLSATDDVELPDAELFPKQEPEPADVQRAAEMLAHASRPLIWAGGGANLSDCSPELLELAIALNAPVITTPEGKGAIPENHPLSLGAFYYGHGPGYRLIPQADVILAVGSRLTLAPRLSWAFQPHQKLIQIDADPEEVGRNWPTELGMVADAKLALARLLEQMGDRARSSQWSAGEMATIKEDTRNLIRDQAPLQTEIIDTIREELEEDAIVVPGVTNIGYWSRLAFPVLKPRSYLTSSYFATLGFAFPTAVGAKIGNPQRQVVALCGDGGFMFACTELTTAAQEGANVVALVFNNGLLGATHTDQRDRYAGRYIGTGLPPVDYVKLAESLGATGVKLSSHQELGEALRSALHQRGPVVIEVPVPLQTPPFQITPIGA